MSVMSDIQTALAARLQTISTANGYSLTVGSVYYDKIPMGLELETHEVPAILLLINRTKITRQVGCNENIMVFEVQLVHDGSATDQDMFKFVSDVYRAVYADSSIANRLDAFRSIHPSIYDIKSDGPEFDLNMIDANRFAILDLQVYFRSTYINL